MLTALVGLNGWLVWGLLLSPLRTAHVLTSHGLEVRYGRDRFAVPRSAVVAVEPSHERIDPLYAVRARYDARHGRVFAALSGDNQLMVRLNQPLPLRIDGALRSVSEVVINADRRDDLVRALTAPSVAQQPPEAATLPHRDNPPLTAPLALTRASACDTAAIEADGLVRRYGDRVVVDRLDLRIPPGEIYGFLGINGAGKSTTIGMLVGLLRPHAGRARIAGHDVWADPEAAKAALGYLADRALLYHRLTGREFLHFLAQLRGVPLPTARRRVDGWLAALDLADNADIPCGAYSFGMRRKLALAGALLGPNGDPPPVLILDEPLNGLDPQSARRLKDLLQELAGSGTAVLLSTHDLAAAEAVCQRVGILHRGRLLVEGPAAQLRDLGAAASLEDAFLDLTRDAVAAP